MGKVTLGASTHLFTASLFWASLASAAGPFTSIQAPCQPDDEAAKSPNGFRKCSEFNKDLVTTLNKEIQDKVDYLYKGCDIVTGIGASADKPGACSHPIVRTPCNAHPQLNRYSGGITELIEDHNKKSCGLFTDVHSHINGGCSWDGDCWMSVTGDATHGQGTVEEAWRSGISVSALDCFETEVENQITKTRQLTISGVPGAGEPGKETCRGMAMQYYALQSREATLNQKFATRENIKDVINSQDCINLGDDRGRLRQSAHYLCAARNALEGLYMAVAACEVFNRSAISYQNFWHAFAHNAINFNSGWESNTSAILRSCHSAVDDPDPACTRAPASDGDQQVDQPCTPNEGDGAKIQHCYNRTARDLFQNQLESWYKVGGSCRMN